MIWKEDDESIIRFFVVVVRCLNEVVCVPSARGNCATIHERQHES